VRHHASASAREASPDDRPRLDQVTPLLVQRALRTGDPRALDEHAVRRLQRQVGNRAVATALGRSRPLPVPVVQREEAEPVAEGERPLKAARFVDSDRLQKAARSSPPLKLNESDDAVARMQRAFLDLGYKMPITTSKGGPTGFYGQETAGTVRQFQTNEGVRPVGGTEAGKKTLTKLDEVCLKHDAAIESGPPALTGGALVSTRPAIETPDNAVSKPEAAATPGATAPAPAAEHEHRLQIEIKGGIEGDIHLNKKPGPDEPSPFGCDKLKLEVGIKGNINVLKLGDRLTLIPNVGVSASLLPLACGKPLGVEAHIDLLKLKLAQAAELGVMVAAQPKNDQFTGWITGAGISVEVKPSKSLPLFVGIDGKAGVERVPIGGTGHFVWFLSGGFGVKYEFGFF
jgi:peptidoglycan hydrolase-like protein with peptidoglycan-binding domain